MPSNIWILFSGRNESRNSRYLRMMRWVTLALMLLVSTCLADEDASYSNSEIVKQAEENIRLLRQAKELVERKEWESNSLAKLADMMIKDSFDSQLMSKMDILYDNQTDLNKELKFNPQVFNCGKEFDIFKVLELAKAHRNITTEQPPCILDEDIDMCTTKKTNDNSGGSNTEKTKSTPPAKKEDSGLRALAIQVAGSTRVPPPARQPVERRTEPPHSIPMKHVSTASPQTKAARAKPSLGNNKKGTGSRLAPDNLIRRLQKEGINNGPGIEYAKPFEDNAQIRENAQISEDQPQRWYAAQVENNEPQQYSSNENGAQVNSQDPQMSEPEIPFEPLRQRLYSLPLIHRLSQQALVEEQPSSSQVEEQPLPPQVDEQPQQQNSGVDEIARQNQPDLLQNSKEVSGQGEHNGDSNAIIHNVKKQNLEKKVSGIPQIQQLQQVNKPATAGQSVDQQQFLDQQKQFYQQQLQPLQKEIQQPQPVEKQDQQQHHTSEQLNQQNQQQFQTSEKQQYSNNEQQRQQQLQCSEQQKQQQLQNAEQQKQQQLQNAEQQKQQQLHAEQQKQQQLQTCEQQKQLLANEQHNQQLQTAEQQKQQLQVNEQQKQLLQMAEQKKQQLQIAEREKQQLQIAEKQKLHQPQTAEQQFQTMEIPNQQHTAGTDSEHKQPPIAEVPPGSEKLQKTYNPNKSLEESTLIPLRMEQNQQSAKHSVNPVHGPPAKVSQLPDSQSLVKLSTETPYKGLPENDAKLSNSNTDKTMMSAPINVMAMENSSNGNPTSKVNLVPENIPATANFWSPTMIQTPRVQINDNMKTGQNKAASVANKLDSSDIPDNIQENPKEDYVYYQEQE